jgi:hypothetical protein
MRSPRAAQVSSDIRVLDQLVDRAEHRAVERVRCLAVLEGSDVVFGQSLPLADRDVFVPLVRAGSEMGDAQHGELTRSRRQRRPGQQIEAEGEI